MTPQTLITRVCKTEGTDTAHHTSGTRDSHTMPKAAAGSGISDAEELVMLSVTLRQ